jgi:hypothetical protein
MRSFLKGFMVRDYDCRNRLGTSKEKDFCAHNPRQRSESPTMSTFSFTAPTITPSHELDEYNALSASEKQALRWDLYGRSSAATDEEDQSYVDSESVRSLPTPEGVAILLVEMEHALLEAVSEPNGEAYREAMRVAPSVVQSESPAYGFLRHTNYDPLSAAESLASYWALRRLLFGAERAYLPMTLQGAMLDRGSSSKEKEYEDIATLEKRTVFVMDKDQHGRPVLFWDRIRSSKRFACRNSVLRCFFYCWQCISTLPEAQKHGCVILMNMKGYDIYEHFDRILSKRAFDIDRRMPIKVRAIHLCTGSGKSVTELILPVLKHMAGPELRLRTKIHAGSNKEICDGFAAFGLRRVHVDAICHGSFHNNETLRAWLHQRRALEEIATP